MTAGLIVAGGYSTRFGIAEKALADAGREPMLRRAVRALDPLVEDVVIDCRSDQVDPFTTALEPLASDPVFAVDPEPDGGPIAGLANGLTTVRELGNYEDVLVLSCDRPGVTTDALERLHGRRIGADVAAAVPSIDGQIQPLCGSYRTEALYDACLATLAAGTRQLTHVPHRLCHLAVPSDAVSDGGDGRQLRSVDSPAELAVHPASDGATRAPAVDCPRERQQDPADRYEPTRV